jgi:hypothetical protein
MQLQSLGGNNIPNLGLLLHKLDRFLVCSKPVGLVVPLNLPVPAGFIEVTNQCINKRT